MRFSFSRRHPPRSPDELAVNPFFPAWYRRLRPDLNAEFDNPIFEAFHRLEQARRARKSFVRHCHDCLANFKQQASPSTLLLLLADLLTLRLLSHPLCRFARHAYRPARDQSPAMPHALSNVITPVAFREQAALEIWLTGCDGKLVLESHYLRTESFFSGSYAARFYFLGFVALSVTILLFPFPNWSTVAVCVLATALAAIGLHKFLLSKRGLPISRRANLNFFASDLLAACEPFRTDEAGHHRVNSPTCRIAVIAGSQLQIFWMALAAIATLGVVLAGFEVFARYAGEIYTRLGIRCGCGHYYWADWPRMIAMYFLFVVLVFSIFSGVLRHLPPGRKQAIRNERAELRAEYAWNLYMSSVVANDPDGAAWARDAYPLGWEIECQRRQRIERWINPMRWLRRKSGKNVPAGELRNI